MAKANYIRVVIDRAIHRELDYLVPETLSERVGVGSRVRVPFRERSALATVVAILDHSEAEGLRSIEATFCARHLSITKHCAHWSNAVWRSCAKKPSFATRTATSSSSQPRILN